LFLTFLKWVDYRNLTKQWSDFEKALSLWIQRFNNDDNRSKALVFISDWWDVDDNIDKKNLENIINNVKWITYYVVWVWTNKWWKIITWRDIFWWYSYQQYKGKDVISKINKSNLNDIASVLDAEYIDVLDVWDLQKLNKSIDKLSKTVLKKDINWEKWDFWRVLTIFSFINFLIFIFLYLFDEKIYFLIKKIWKK
jgi:hypothetical protein